MTSEKHYKERVERETNSLLRSLTDWGYADIETAIETALEVDMNGSELADLVRQESEDLDTPLDKMDINYTIYEHILQMARNKIDEVVKYDFINDFSGDTEIYTYGNAMCTSFDYSQKAVDNVKEKLVGASEDDREELKQDKFVNFLVEHIDLSWEDVEKEAKSHNEEIEN